MVSSLILLSLSYTNLYIAYSNVLFSSSFAFADFNNDAFVSIDPPGDNDYPYALNDEEGIDRLFDFSDDTYGS